MTDVICAGCGSNQREGAPFCAACGREFPRTGRPVVEQFPSSNGQMRQASRNGVQSDASFVPMVESHPSTTTEVESYTATRIPSAGMVPKKLGAPYAGVGRRFLAWLIDATVGGILAVAVALIGLSMAGFSPGMTVVSVEEAQRMGKALILIYVLTGLVPLCYQIGLGVWEALTGKTLGNLAMGIRTVSAETRERIGLVRELWRLLVLAAGALVCGLGQIVVLLSPQWDKGGKVRGWHDKAARSVVLNIRAPQVALATGLAPVPPGSHAPGQPAMAAQDVATPVQQAPVQQVPEVPQTSAPAADPWGFPQAASSNPSESLITGVPGGEPSTPPAMSQAPVQQNPPVQSAPAPSRAAADEHTWDATRTQAPVMVPAAMVNVVLELESGERRVIDGPALVGRNPQAAEGSEVILVRVEDPTRSVSKNHAELGVDSAGLWLTDRGSTNGTVVSAPGRSPQVSEPGTRVRVPVGSTIHVGDRRIVVHPHESQV